MKPITKEQVRKLKKELNYTKLDTLKGVVGTQDYTGHGKTLGVDSVHNSRLCGHQFLFALALSQHPLVWKEVQTEDHLDFKKLMDGKVLDGMKIIDLGCGYMPGFARCTRYLGADTYTVDIIPSDKFESYDLLFPDEYRKMEADNHIILDLNTDGALEEIIKITGGDFDLVTQAHLNADTQYNGRFMACYLGRIIAKGLLKQGGAYYDGGDIENFDVKVGDEL